MPIVFDGGWVDTLIDLAVKARTGQRCAKRSNLDELERDVAHFRKFVSNRTVKAPWGFSASCLMEGVHDAIRIFAEEPTRLKMRKDITEMWRLAGAAIEAEDRAIADRRNKITNVDEAYDQLAHFLSTVSLQVRDYLNESTIGCLSQPSHDTSAAKGFRQCMQNRVQVTLPLPDTLRKPALRRQACIDVWTMCTSGVVVPRPKEGQEETPAEGHCQTQVGFIECPNHPGLRYRLNAPRLRRMDRMPELLLVFRMHMAWLNAWPMGGRQPNWTARHDCENPNPFVEFANQVLRLIGSHLASAVSLLNELHEVRKDAASWQFDEKKERLKRKILRCIGDTGAKSQTDISRLISHPPRGLIAAALSDLQHQGMLSLTVVKGTGGRARRIWSRVDAHQSLFLHRPVA